MKHQPNEGFLPRSQFAELLQAIRNSGYRIVGPMVRDGAIVYDDIQSLEELPKGILQEASPGKVRITTTDSPRHFTWANGPQALKPLVFKPSEMLWQSERDPQGRLIFTDSNPEVEATAVIGVRACDIAALKLQDKHFLEGAFREKHYAMRRKQLLLVAVNCTHPAETCFCASTGDGPEVTDSYDLLLDELDTGYIVRVGSDKGRKIMAQLKLHDVAEEQQQQASTERQAARDFQTRSIPAGDLYDDLFSKLDHPRWNEVADRCLSCGNCTQVCPTCFCNHEQDDADLSGEKSVHYRAWDSCFNEEHSAITGTVIRKDVKHRYRQWLTHKLGGWFRQFGRSGCVGCGRCIAWCPVGIDITEEVNVIKESSNDH